MSMTSLPAAQRLSMREVMHMIHETAIISPEAKIANDVEIGPWTYIKGRVEIGQGTKIGPHVVIQGPTKIGKNNKICQFASLGEDPQHIAYAGEETFLEIGDHNQIREFVTMNRATNLRDKTTRVGSHNFFMAYAHVAHDCRVGNHVIFANNASIAGNVVVDDHVILGAFVGIHQNVNIGAYSFSGRSAKIPQDILPFMMAVGNPGAPIGLNTVGLKRNGFNDQTIRQLQKAFLLIFKKGLKLKEAESELEKMLIECPKVQLLLDAIRRSERGIAR